MKTKSGLGCRREWLGVNLSRGPRRRVLAQPGGGQSSLFTLQFSILLLLATGLLGVFAPRAEATPQKMWMTFAGYTRAEVLTNFPVLVAFSNNVGGSGFNYNSFLSTGGYDLRFVAFTNQADTNSLNYEIESWDPNGTSYVWVQVPSLPNDRSGAIWAKWGDPANRNQLPCTTNGSVWTDGYLGVWHMNQPNTQDSTTNRFNGTPNGNTNAVGIIGGCQGFGPQTNSVGLGMIAAVTRVTVEAWVKHNTLFAKTQRYASFGAESAVIRNGSSSQLHYYGNIAGSINAPSQTANILSVGPWYYVAGAYDGANQRLYNAGTQLVSNAKTGNLVAITNGYFSAQYGEYMDGLIDEVRLSSVARSANWLWACYQTVANNAAFNNYGLMTSAISSPQQMQIAFAGYTNRSEVLTNFPVLVVFNNNVAGSGFNYANFLSSSGYDLRFGASLRDASLNYEIESWNPFGASYIWVQVPTIPTNGSGTIWAKWGDPANSAQLPCTTNGATWDSDYLSVWHMGQPNIQDSTTNQNVGYASPTPTTTAAGGAGASQDFTASPTRYISFGNQFNVGAATVEAWINHRTQSGVMRYVTCGNEAAVIRLQSPNLHYYFIDSGNTIHHVQTDSIANGQWTHVVGTYDGTTQRLWKNGASVGSSTFTVTMRQAAGGGLSSSGGEAFDGQMDEVRLSKKARSANWLWATYLTMASNTVFNNYGAMEKQPSPKGTVMMMR